MIKYNYTELYDKILGCWIGKNIGGTIGGPYEGVQDILDVKGFTSKEGEPLPNDDLDLQLVWLTALEKVGPARFTSMDLADYWCMFVTPNWNEYGTAKSNLRIGLQPPLCGDIDNHWRNSNGAWIRSEIWACLAPGNIDVAIEYAYKDACVDHGVTEGTYAEIFLASLECAAFIEKDLNKLIKISLSKIPDDCRVARAVKLLIKSYNEGLDWITTRNLIVEDSKDLGWFQAPANIAFTLLGLLYGQGDFKKSILLAVNCGDDTDCTGATAGAILGILKGRNNIPSDWVEYISDRIITISINEGDLRNIPKNCSELTNRIIDMIPEVIKYGGGKFIIHNDETVFDEESIKMLYSNNVSNKLISRKRFSFEMDFKFADVDIIYDREPKIVPDGTINVSLVFKNKFPIPASLSIRFITPDGFVVRGPKQLHLSHYTTRNRSSVAEYTITAGPNVEYINRIILEVICEGRPNIGLAELVILG